MLPYILPLVLGASTVMLPFARLTSVTSLQLKQGDLEPPATASIMDVTGAAVDLTTATGVQFRLSDTLTRTEVFVRSAAVDDANSGQVSYHWQAGDTDLSGVYYAEFVVTWPGARSQTYPADGYLVVDVEPKL